MHGNCLTNCAHHSFHVKQGTKVSEQSQNSGHGASATKALWVSSQAGLIQNSASRKNYPETPLYILAALVACKQRATKGFNPTANSGIEKDADLWSEKTPSTQGMQWTYQFSLIYGQHKNWSCPIDKDGGSFLPALALERENKIEKKVANPVVEGDLCDEVQETCERVGMHIA